MLDLGDSMRIVMENQDATMCPIIASVAVSWVSKSVSASDLKVLAHGVVLLAVEMGLHKDTKLVVTAPEPVKCVLTEGCYVGHMDMHFVLRVPGPFWRCAMERWIVV